MNKQFFACLILCMAWCFSANAEVVTRQQALQKAQQFMGGKQFSEPAQRRGQMLSSSSAAYYVFNAESEGGFVIVAGDDRMPEILGYSEHVSHGDRHLGMGACFHGYFFAIFLMVS